MHYKIAQRCPRFRYEEWRGSYNQKTNDEKLARLLFPDDVTINPPEVYYRHDGVPNTHRSPYSKASLRTFEAVGVRNAQYMIVLIV